MNIIETLHIITEPTRYRLLSLLFEYHYCVRALAKKLDISEPAVSQHMRILKRYKIVFGIKIGHQVHYRADKQALISLLDKIKQQILEHPSETQIEDCYCEFIADCIKRDAKILEEQARG